MNEYRLYQGYWKCMTPEAPTRTLAVLTYYGRVTKVLSLDGKEVEYPIPFAEWEFIGSNDVQLLEMTGEKGVGL